MEFVASVFFFQLMGRKRFCQSVPDPDCECDTVDKALKNNLNLQPSTHKENRADIFTENFLSKIIRRQLRALVLFFSLSFVYPPPIKQSWEKDNLCDSSSKSCRLTQPKYFFSAGSTTLHEVHFARGFVIGMLHERVFHRFCPFFSSQFVKSSPNTFVSAALMLLSKSVYSAICFLHCLRCCQSHLVNSQQWVSRGSFIPAVK